MNNLIFLFILLLLPSMAMASNVTTITKLYETKNILIGTFSIDCSSIYGALSNLCTITAGNGTGNASWNESYANTLYYPYSNPYNYTNSTSGGNSSWNESYANSLFLKNYTRSSTRIVCASNSLDKTDCDYVASGINDQDTIQAAVNSLSSTGGKVLLMEGTLNISETLYLNVSNMILQGMGKSTILNLTKVSMLGIIINNATHITVKDLNIKGINQTAAQQGIILTSNYNDVLDSYFSTINIAIRLGSTVSTNFRNSAVNNYILNSTTGIWAVSSDSLVLNNKLENCTTGISITGLSDENNVMAINNYIKGSRWGILFTGGQGHSIQNNMIVDSTTHGIYSYSGYGYCSITGNNIRNSSSSGIYITGSSEKNIIGSNEITNFTQNGIYTSSNDNVIQTNIITSPNASSGINLNSGSFNIIAGNKIGGNMSIGIKIGSSHSQAINETINFILNDTWYPVAYPYIINGIVTSIMNDTISLTFGNWTNNATHIKLIGNKFNGTSYGVTYNYSAMYDNSFYGNNLVGNWSTSPYVDYGASTWQFNNPSGSTGITEWSQGWAYIWQDVLTELQSPTQTEFYTDNFNVFDQNKNPFFKISLSSGQTQILGSGGLYVDEITQINGELYVLSEIDGSSNIKGYGFGCYNNPSCNFGTLFGNFSTSTGYFIGNGSQLTDISTFNSTYDALVTDNQSWNESRYQAIWNATNTSYMTSTYNSTYDALITTNNVSNNSLFFNGKGANYFWNMTGGIPYNNMTLANSIVKGDLASAFSINLGNISGGEVANNWNMSVYNQSYYISAEATPTCSKYYNSTGILKWCDCYNSTHKWMANSC